MNKESLFTVLRNPKYNHHIAQKKAVHFFFKLEKDEYGYFAEPVDKTGSQVMPDERLYPNPISTALRLYYRLKEQMLWQIEWRRDSNRVYLSDSAEFASLLIQCGNLVSSKMKVITASENSPADLLLRGTLIDEEILWQPCLRTGTSDIRNFKMITSTLAISGKRIFTTKPIIDYEHIKLFNTTSSEKDSEKILSLYISLFPDGLISYKDYDIKTGQHSGTAPALVLEDVDDSGTLYMSVQLYMENTDIDFINNYELNSIVTVDDSERAINIIRIDPVSLDYYINRIVRKLKKYSDKYSLSENLFIIQKDLAVKFLESELHTLISDFIIIGAKKLENFKIKTVKPGINLRISSGIDFLEGSAEIVVDSQTFDFIDFIHRFEENNYIILNDGTRAIIEHGFIKKLKRLIKSEKNGKISVSFFDLPLIEDIIDSRTTGKPFIKSRKLLEGFNNIEDNPPVVPELRFPLREYQKTGFYWLKYLHQTNLCGCLADDMGLGKTVQAIALLASIFPTEKKPALVVMPKSLLFNWKREIEKFAPDISSYLYYGTDRNIKHTAEYNVILTTYEVVRNDIENLKEINFACVIIDESQKIKNISSKISKAVLLLNAEWRLALSGTPIENNLLELYSLFRFLNPAMFGSYKNFCINYLNPISKEGNTYAMTEMKKKIYPFILRRLKSDVLKELPEKTEQTVFVDMSKEQEQLYNNRRDFYYTAIKRQIDAEGFGKSRFFMFQALNELRQIAGIPETKSGGTVKSPKTEILMELLKETVDNEHKVLVFANYLEALHLIGEQLSEMDIDFLTITGKTSNREKIVDSFQTEKRYKVLLMTLKTGGVGLNLTAADYVFIFDPWWNAAAEAQAVDRVHRIGQKNAVFSYKLITRNTIEEKILLLQQQKTELVNTLIESDDNNIKQLSEEDIDFIFSGNNE